MLTLEVETESGRLDWIPSPSVHSLAGLFVFNLLFDLLKLKKNPRAFASGSGSKQLMGKGHVASP